MEFFVNIFHSCFILEFSYISTNFLQLPNATFFFLNPAFSTSSLPPSQSLQIQTKNLSSYPTSLTIMVYLHKMLLKHQNTSISTPPKNSIPLSPFLKSTVSPFTRYNIYPWLSQKFWKYISILFFLENKGMIHLCMYLVYFGMCLEMYL